MLERPIDEPRFTYGDYLRWQGDERWELVDGVPFDMSPAPGRRHQAVVGALFSQVLAFLEGDTCRAYVAPFDVRLPHAGEADAAVTTVVQPDISIICDRSKLDDAGCRGAPDWVIEVMSPRTAARDLSLKRDLYEKSGVREYWVVDPAEQSLTVFELTVGRYGTQRIGPASEHASPTLFPRLTIDWGRVFAD